MPQHPLCLTTADHVAALTHHRKKNDYSRKVLIARLFELARVLPGFLLQDHDHHDPRL